MVNSSIRTDGDPDHWEVCENEIEDIMKTVNHNLIMSDLPCEEDCDREQRERKKVTHDDDHNPEGDNRNPLDMGSHIEDLEKHGRVDSDFS